MDMLKSRNTTSHSYNEDVAKEICQAVFEVYYFLFVQLKTNLESLRADSDKYDFGNE